jgi:hypothetical protein
LSALVVGVFVALPAATAAASGQVAVENQRGPLVNAWFSSPDPADPSGCRYLEAFVTANSDSVHAQSGTTPDGVAAVSIDTFDYCTGQTLSQALGQADLSSNPGAFVVSNQLDRASLDLTIPVTDLDTGAVSDVSVDVTWTGTSAIYRNHENTNDVYARDCHVLNRWKGSGRDASASGTVWDGTTDFTPAASQYGEIGLVIDGFQVIGCS